MKVIFSPTAIKDLAESVAYVARHDREAAIRLGEGLIKAAEGMLSSQPQAGPVCPEYAGTEVRYWLFRGYRIVYEVHSDRGFVSVLRFWHCARGDWPVEKEGEP